MLETIKEYLGEESEKVKSHRLREFLQLLILDALHQKTYFRNISFLGGTALRILYKIKRYSEDLDFCMVSRGNYNFDELVSKVAKELQLNNLIVDVKMKQTIGAVKSCFFRFPGLLYNLGFSPLKDQKLAIKFEVDENPPANFATELTMLTDRFTIAINHFDKASLFAGKLHAILSRQYTKGRDYFDLIWFISSGIKPNIRFLESALEQTNNKKYKLSLAAIKERLCDKILETDFKAVIKDLKPFIIDEQALEHYSQDTFINLVRKQL
jgi:predicted nucleotidyltransferase component of viral defense system